MTKLLKLLSITSATGILLGNSFILTACKTPNMLNLQTKHSDNASLLKWKLDPYQRQLVTKYEGKVHQHASADSIKEFNELYDSNKQAATWKDYKSLQYDLTHTQIGNHTINVNWTKMYQNDGLSAKQVAFAQERQLRFYNIFAKVYQKSNVIRLIQNVDPVPVEDNVVAWTMFDPQINSQRMGYGPDFVNSDLIKDQYDQGFWSSNEIISVSTHEYGHALSNFMGLDANNRKSINENWDWRENAKTNLDVNTVNTKPSYYATITNQTRQIENRTDCLIKFLGDSAHIVGNEEKELFGLVVVDSNYGRIAWSEGKEYLKDEFFAESFAGWLLTPEKQRDWGWELKNNFFLHYLPAAL